MPTPGSVPVRSLILTHVYLHSQNSFLESHVPLILLDSCAGRFWHPAGARPLLTSSTAESLVLLTADAPWVSSTLADPPYSQCPIPPSSVSLTVALWWRKPPSHPWWDVWYSSINEDPALITMLLHWWPMVSEYCLTTHVQRGLNYELGDPLESSFRSDLTSSGVDLSSLREGQVPHVPLLIFSEVPPIAQV